MWWVIRSNKILIKSSENPTIKFIIRRLHRPVAVSQTNFTDENVNKTKWIYDHIIKLRPFLSINLWSISTRERNIRHPNEKPITLSDKLVVAGTLQLQVNIATFFCKVSAALYSAGNLVSHESVLHVSQFVEITVEMHSSERKKRWCKAGIYQTIQWYN